MLAAAPHVDLFFRGKMLEFTKADFDVTAKKIQYVEKGQRRHYQNRMFP